MKKTISLVLALVMCLSLCACGKESVQEAEGHNTLATQEVSVDTHTEAVVVNTEPTQPQIIEVELTSENWQEYFDSNNIQIVYEWSKNSFDEVEDFFAYKYYIPLKEEYKHRMTNLHETEIAYELAGIDGERNITIDIENMSVSVGAEWVYDIGAPEETTKDGKVYGIQLVETGLPFGECYKYYAPDGGFLAGLFEATEVVRIKGTIYLLAE